VTHFATQAIPRDLRGFLIKSPEEMTKIEDIVQSQNTKIPEYWPHTLKEFVSTVLELSLERIPKIKPENSELPGISAFFDAMPPDPTKKSEKKILESYMSEKKKREVELFTDHVSEVIIVLSLYLVLSPFLSFLLPPSHLAGYEGHLLLQHY
jgi:hypothetical protein